MVHATLTFLKTVTLAAKLQMREEFMKSYNAPSKLQYLPCAEFTEKQQVLRLGNCDCMLEA